MLSLAGSGGTRKALTKTMIERFRVPLPDLSEQRKIAGLLSAYDDLIQNNRRRIALLEHAARELYREWFVRLRFPGHESTRIVDGLPDGWEKIRVRDLLGRAKSRKKIKKNDYLATGRIPCIDQSKEFIGGYTNDEDAKHEDPLPIIVFGDHTRILKFVDFPFVRGADGTQLLTPNRECISVPYLYFALDAIDLPDYSYARHLKFLKDQVVLIPANTIEDKFTAFVADAMSYVKVLREQNVTLASARDLLLPPPDVRSAIGMNYNLTKFPDQSVKPVLEARWLEMTIHNKPRNSRQKYRITANTQQQLDELTSGEE